MRVGRGGVQHSARRWVVGCGPHPDAAVQGTADQVPLQAALAEYERCMTSLTCMPPIARLQTLLLRGSLPACWDRHALLGPWHVRLEAGCKS